ncbi:hypothetical protein ES706_04829 [subsurface metagenome]|nr:hypothetical protein [Hadesarchaea archaeon]
MISNFLENEDNQDKIEKLSRENIETIKFGERYGNTTLGELIKRLYSDLREEKFIGSTGASKFLHFLNTDLFVMWDGNICDSYHHKEGSPGGYLKFMGEMKTLAKHLFDEIKKLGESDLKEYMIRELARKGYKPTIPKLLDEYNYVISEKK